MQFLINLRFRKDVNVALRNLGLRPRLIPLWLRQSAEARGRRYENTPQEVALIIASDLPVSGAPDLNMLLIDTWIQAKAVRVSRDDVSRSLIRLGRS